MRYLVTARVKRGKEAELLRAIEEGTLGAGSVAGKEYLRNMENARVYDDGRIKWVEVCFCDTPLAEERKYWEAFFELDSVRDALSRKCCRDLTGEEPWACSECDHTDKLETKLAGEGHTFLDTLRARHRAGAPK
ncbi:MAG: hypothetical protein LV481_11365 [Methylacidiphilales bacterium]|nr:hypothetical protein [Candidatus Methylacidiphilales bacterium]